MKSTTLFMLAGGAIAVIAGVVLVEGRSGNTPKAVEGAGAYFLPALQDRGNEVAAITIVRDGQTTNVRKGEAGWQLPDKGGYPAKLESVRNLIVAMSQLKAAEPMTAKPENYSKLGVQDPATAPPAEGEMGGGPALVTLKDAKDQPLASVIVGQPKWGTKPGVYVRRAGEPQSWLAEGQLDLPMGLAGWTDTKVMDIARDRVKSASAHHADGEVVTVSRAAPDATTFSVENAPAGKELKGPSVGDPLGAALAYVNFEDVAPVTTIDFSGKDGGKPGALCTFQTFEGTSITVQTVEKDGKHWAQFAVAHDPVAVSAPPAPGQTLKTPDDAKKEAEELAARLSPWAFQIPQYKVASLNTRMAELLKETPPQAPASMQGTETIDPAKLFEPPPAQPQPAPAPLPPPGS